MGIEQNARCIASIVNQFCGYANYARRCRFRYRGRRFYYLRRRTNKVRKSRGGYPDTEEEEERKKTFRPARGFDKKGIVRAFLQEVEQRLPPTRCVTGSRSSYWVFVLSDSAHQRTTATLMFARPEAVRICFSNFRSFARAQPTSVAAVGSMGFRFSISCASYRASPCECGFLCQVVACLRNL